MHLNLNPDLNSNRNDDLNENSHAAMRKIIDKSLLGEASVHEQHTLQEHVATCDACQEYLNTSNRVVAGLGGFSFAVDAALQGKVMDSLTLRAQQLALQGERRPIGWFYLAAFLLTVTGSLTVARLSGLVVTAVHLQPALLQVAVLALWIVPSLCFCLLFPVVHRLTTGEKGMSQ